MNESQCQSEIENLLNDSPITIDSVIEDVRDLLTAGELPLAFDTMCSWIYEDELTISKEYHNRLLMASKEMGSRALVERLYEMVPE